MEKTKILIGYRLPKSCLKNKTDKQTKKKKQAKIKLVSDSSVPPLKAREQVLRRKRAGTQEFLYPVKFSVVYKNFRKNFYLQGFR